MNQDILQGQWKQMTGQMRNWWGKLTDNDLQRIQGNRDKLVGALQEKYGWSREQAIAEVDRRIDEYERTHTTRV